MSAGALTVLTERTMAERTSSLADPRAFADFIEEKRELIRTTFAPKASAVEFALFIDECKMRMLNPFAKQIYLIPFGTKHVTIPSLHGLRLIAARTGEFAGRDPYEYDIEEGDHPNKATCTVYRMVQGVRCPFTSSVRWSERNKGENEWRKQPFHMLGKCAETDALRTAFPEECGGLYTDDEMVGDGGAPEPPRTVSGLLPSGLKEDQFARLEAEASQRGVTLTRGMTLAAMAEVIEARGGPRLPGTVKAGDIWGAIKRVPPPAPEPPPTRPARLARPAEPAPAAQEPIEGQAREEKPEVDPETGEVIPPYVGQAALDTNI